MHWFKLYSPTVVSGQILEMSSSRLSTWPWRRTRKVSVSKALGVMETASPCRKSRRPSGSSWNSPNSYTSLAIKKIGEALQHLMILDLSLGGILHIEVTGRQWLQTARL